MTVLNILVGLVAGLTCLVKFSPTTTLADPLFTSTSNTGEFSGELAAEIN